MSSSGPRFLVYMFWFSVASLLSFVEYLDEATIYILYNLSSHEIDSQANSHVSANYAKKIIISLHVRA